MARDKHGPLTGEELEIIQELWGLPYAVEVELPDGDTPENVRPGYCRAFMAHFQDAGLSFSLPPFLLELLAELEMAFTQITPNFFRYLMATYIQAREEGLEFGLAELKQLYTLKRNNGFPGTMLLAPREGRSIISCIPNKDIRWKDNSFVFKISPATIGDFGFSRIPGKWKEKVGKRFLRFSFRYIHSSFLGSVTLCCFSELFGYANMTPELRGLIAALCRGGCHWSSFTPERIRNAYALPQSLNRAAPIALAEPVHPQQDRKGKGKSFYLSTIMVLWI